MNSHSKWSSQWTWYIQLWTAANEQTIKFIDGDKCACTWSQFISTNMLFHVTACTFCGNNWQNQTDSHINSHISHLSVRVHKWKIGPLLPVWMRFSTRNYGWLVGMGYNSNKIHSIIFCCFGCKSNVIENVIQF